jgi:hypothetical protein
MRSRSPLSLPTAGVNLRSHRWWWSQVSRAFDPAAGPQLPGHDPQPRHRLLEGSFSVPPPPLSSFSFFVLTLAFRSFVNFLLRRSSWATWRWCPFSAAPSTPTCPSCLPSWYVNTPSLPHLPRDDCCG